MYIIQHFKGILFLGTHRKERVYLFFHLPSPPLSFLPSLPLPPLFSLPLFVPPCWILNSILHGVLAHVKVQLQLVNLSYNSLIGKILSIEDTYAKIVTPLGNINTLISSSWQYFCTATNIDLHYSTKISFSRACKKASNLQTFMNL